MKRTLAILTAIALLIGIAPAALAGTVTAADLSAVTETTTTTTTPSADPGSFSYVIQRMFERVKVILTPDRAARAELLAAHAQRRIVELGRLPVAKDGKAFKIVLGLCKDFVNLLRRATDDIAAARAAGKPITAAEQQLLEAAVAAKVAEKGFAAAAQELGYNVKNNHKFKALREQGLNCVRIERNRDECKGEGKRVGKGLGKQGKHTDSEHDDRADGHHESAGKGWGGK